MLLALILSAALCGQAPDPGPAATVTVSWTNKIHGDGSTTLAYRGRGRDGRERWASGNARELVHELYRDRAGRLEYRITYYLSGAYPTGQSQYASTGGRPPFRLDPAGAVCGPGLPMAIATDAKACPVLSAYGFTGFVVSGSMDATVTRP
jgi:hypothetical protein